MTQAPAEELRREFTGWSTFSLAFAFISPIVALYGIFGIGLSSIGPGFWWGFPITLTGQLLVALTLGRLASRWPFEGGVYQWSRRLVGERYGWFAGWVYMWTLVIAMASVAYSGATFLAAVIGLEAPSVPVLILLSLLLLALTTAGNTIGRKVVKLTVGLCLFAEVVGSVGIGVYLLVFHHEQPLSVLSSGLSVAPGTALMSMPIVLAIGFAGWSFLGFESASTIAEEVRDPQRAVPRAMVFSLVSVALVVCFTAFSIIMAIPDMAAVTSGAVADPVLATLEAHLPAGVVRAVLLLFVIAFVASLLGIQAAASRVVWAYGRDRALPGSATLVKLSGEDRMPRNAILLTGLVSALLYLPFQNDHVYAILVAFTSAGFYAAFSFPVLGLVVASLRRRWQPGPFLNGRLGTVITYAAIVWLTLEVVNIVWPRYPELGWAINWAPFLMAVVLGAAGVVVRSLSLKEA
ncbi:amino acid permease [Actinoplanes sp. OR16]|uniref:APC family permease n=1 Tax=Actinoplanes sp. OR16 TaxID=946334 RepID=UPI000F7138A4|nr:amino acid permease [Actinoplanes sp. OR16]BBH69781.1 amino acid permease [Actinoplanes sp. OR16]